MKIKDWRAEIDEVDEMIVHLLNRRAELARKICEVKRLNASPICDPARETEVLQHVRRSNNGPLSDQVIEKIFRRIIFESKSLEIRHLKELTANNNNLSTTLHEVAR